MEKIKEKIQKLLALSTSPNEHEAAQAAAKMNELLTRHNLDVSDLGQSCDEDLELQEFSAEKSRLDSWRAILSVAIAKTNYCEVWLKSRRGSRQLIILGRPINIIACKNLYEYLEEVVERLAGEAAAKYKRETGVTDRSYRSSFKLGCANRLSERLEDQHRLRNQEGIAGSDDSAPVSAIVCRSLDEREQEAIARWMANSNINFRNRKVGANYSSADGLSDGAAAANNIGLNGQISGRSVKRLGAAS